MEREDFQSPKLSSSQIPSGALAPPPARPPAPDTAWFRMLQLIGSAQNQPGSAQGPPPVASHHRHLVGVVPARTESRTHPSPKLLIPPTLISPVTMFPHVRVTFAQPALSLSLSLSGSGSSDTPPPPDQRSSRWTHRHLRDRGHLTRTREPTARLCLSPSALLHALLQMEKRVAVAYVGILNMQ